MKVVSRSSRMQRGEATQQSNAGICRLHHDCSSQAHPRPPALTGGGARPQYARQTGLGARNLEMAMMHFVQSMAANATRTTKQRSKRRATVAAHPRGGGLTNVCCYCC